MRIEIHGRPSVLGSALRSHTETRLWLAAQQHARRLAWISVLFSEHDGEGESRRTTCKIAAGLRPTGTLSIQHTHVDPFIAVDMAGARFAQALSRCRTEVIYHGGAEPAQWEVPA